MAYLIYYLYIFSCHFFTYIYLYSALILLNMVKAFWQIYVFLNCLAIRAPSTIEQQQFKSCVSLYNDPESPGNLADVQWDPENRRQRKFTRAGLYPVGGCCLDNTANGRKSVRPDRRLKGSRARAQWGRFRLVGRCSALSCNQCTRLSRYKKRLCIQGDPTEKCFTNEF